jgi:predicted  nucleic acid-binding Zn-ribbon protein
MSQVEWGNVAQFLSAGTAGVALIVSIFSMLRSRGEKDVSELRGDLSRIFERLDETEQRLSKVEVEIEHVPTKDQLHALDVKITAQGATLTSILSTMNRLQEFFLEREAK